MGGVPFIPTKEVVVEIDFFDSLGQGVMEKFMAMRGEKTEGYSFVMPVSEFRYGQTTERERVIVFHHTELLLRFLRSTPYEQKKFVEQILEKKREKRGCPFYIRVQWNGKKPRHIHVVESFDSQLHFHLSK